MTEISLNTILKNFSLNTFEPKVTNGIDSVTINLQDAESKTVVFYNLASNKNAVDTFEERLSKTKAKVIIIPESITFNTDKCVISVSRENFLEVQKRVCDLFYPLDVKLPILGVTGTNGKTSVAYFCLQIAKQLNKKAVSIGTLGVMNQELETIQELKNTSPSYVEIRKIIHSQREQCDFVVCEVSSHALSQKRFYDLKFDSSSWTNLTQDHLDYHKTMEEYAKAKLKIVNYLKKDKKCFVMSDQQNVIEYFKEDTKAYLELVDKDNFKYENKGIFQVSYNVQNYALALSMVKSAVKINEVVDPYKIKNAPGRSSTVDMDDFTGVVDYAHTPDALENILKNIRSSNPDTFIITVFGCGGDRDPKKRPLMGRVAESFSNFIIVTSDNPRTEDPNEIINQIVGGLSSKEFSTISDRRDAIKQACEITREKKGILLVAGKGHETYQEVNGVRVHFDDKEELLKIKEEYVLAK